MKALAKWAKAAGFVGVVAGLLVAAGIAVADVRYTGINVKMVPLNPRLGETVDIIARVSNESYDVPELEIRFTGNSGVNLVGWSDKFRTFLPRGVTQEFRFKAKFISSPAGFYVGGREIKVRKRDGRLSDKGAPVAGSGGEFYLYEKLNQFVDQTDRWWLDNDPVARVQVELGLPDVFNKMGPWNSVAAYYYFQIERISKTKGLPREAVIQKVKAMAEALAKQRRISKEKAFEAIAKEGLLLKEEGLYPPSAPGGGAREEEGQGLLRGVFDESIKGTGVSGRWRYYDHKYSRETGLRVDSDQDTMPIRACEIEVFDNGDDDHSYPWVSWGSTYTNPSGYFILTRDLPNHGSWYRIKIVLRAKGPSAMFPKFRVMTPTGDTIWEYESMHTVPPELGGYFNLYPPRYDAVSNRQPISGAWNIYDVMYRASQRAGYPSYPKIVTARWGRGDTAGTYFKEPTDIYIRGKNDDPRGSDEWNDDVILHEYGHFVQHDWTGACISDTAHHWCRPYDLSTEPRETPFTEGWADFFSGMVRDSVLNNSWGPGDSVVLVTNGHIGDVNGVLGYFCLENPWHIRYFKGGTLYDSTDFDVTCGPWTEGTVAAVLYDILDRYVENPYPTKQKLPQWPDSGLADTLRTSYHFTGPICQILKNKRIRGHGVQTIYEFLSGWLHPSNNGGNSYGHWTVLRDILEHHRIPWAQAPCPESLRAELIRVMPQRMRLTWRTVYKGPHILGYNIYRAVDGPSPVYTQLKSDVVVDTVYEDSSIVGGMAYRYFVTAVDSLGLESDSSKSVLAPTVGPGGGDPLATAYNNAPKVLRDGLRRLHVVYTDTGGCYYMMSQDSGATWLPRVKLGSKGRYPGLALDERDSIYAVWTRPPGPAPDTEAQILYSRRHGDGTWDAPVPLARYVMPGVDLYGLSPAALAVQNDTARVVYECYNGTRVLLGPMYNWFYSIFHGTFPTSAPQSVRWQLLDSLHAVVPPHILGITSPSVAADFNHLSHVVWHRLGKVCYREQIGDTTWKPLVDLSQSADWTSWHPSLNLSGNRIGVAWVLESDTLLDVIPPSAICYRSRLLGDTIWGARETLSVGLRYATRPVLSEGPSAAFSASPIAGGSEVYLTNRGTSGWTLPENVSNTILESNFPHLFTVQGVSVRVSDFLWTEGDAAPYEVVYKELSRPIPPRPWYEADVGQANPSLFTVQRDGFLVYGPLPYQTIDYDHQKLIYRFPGLDTMADYRLLLVAYFEKQVQRDNDADRIASASLASDLASPVPEGLALESSKPKIEQFVLLNGTEVGRMELVPGVPDTFSLVIPKALYQGGEVQLTLDKKKGRFASLSELYLYRWGAWGKKVVPSQGASQGGEGVTLLPKVYDLSQSYPNPTKEGLRINYALPKESQVSLKIYNVAGQLVRALREGKEKPGYYVAEWDGKDQGGHRVSSGVYLYRMEAGEFRSIKKLVVVR